MSRVKLADVIIRANTKVDKDHTDLKYYVGGEHFESGNVTVEQRGLIEGSTIGPMFYYGFKAGQFLLVSRNPHLKKAGVVDFDGICSEKTFVLQTANPEVLIPEYLPFVLQNDRFWDYAVEHKHGSTNFFINWSTLADYEFELPSVEEQNRVATLAWAAHRLKKEYHKLIEATDNLVKSQFIEMVGKATSSDKLLNHVDVLYGFPFNSKLFNNNGEGLPLLRIRDINTGLSDTFTTEQADEKYIVSDGDCLVGMDGNFEIVKWNHGSAYLNQRICKFTPIDIQREYMMYFLRLKLKEIESVANSTTVKHLSAKDINGIEIPIVDDAAQLWFEEFSIQSDKSKFELQQAIEKVDNLIKSLIQQDNN